MSLTDKIKHLIADGKTQQAVDMLQSFLKEKSGDDHELYNQTLLLEGQYKELQKKVQLGLQDASGDLNRINYSLLNLCDEAELFVTEADKKMGKEANTLTKNEATEGSENLSMNPLIIFAVIAAVAILTVIGLLFLNKNDVKTAIGQSTDTLPLPKTHAVVAQNWHTLEPVLNVGTHLYGTYKITISSITSESFDSERNRLIVTMKNNCVEASSGTCAGIYLQFRLTTAPNEQIAPESDKALDNQLVKTTREEKVSFVVPKSVNSAILDVFYTDEPQSKASTKIAQN